jgi:metacaspase-1
MTQPLKVMCVHGLGDHRKTPWKEVWQDAVSKVFANYGEVKLEFSFITYDPIFEKVNLSAWETMQAVWKLTRSAVGSVISGRRGIVADVPDKVKWTAGYVVAWLEDEAFKQQTRKLVLDAVASESPDVILAHSLGSLITYNAFSHPDAARAATRTALARAHYVTLGSQIGNPFVVRNLTNGRIEALPVKHWDHLYNKEDAFLTAPIKLWDAANFRQIETLFDIAGIADHSATGYLRHANTIEQVWLPLAGLTSRARSFGGPREKSAKTRASRVKAPTSKRALLVGINAYPRAEDRLEGCVNDVFLMSSVLQECGFPPECIRVCLDERATTKGILERLQWLLDDPKPDEQRVFYYSGHGTRIPQYGENFQPDRHTEALAPWDFDWTVERAIIDDQIFALYSQLPYDTRFAMILDCCHSGGIHRQGGARVRGLNPPDDIRHRELKWDSQSEMWVQRDFNRMNPGFSSEAKVNKAFFGDNGATSRIGRSSILRGQSQSAYRQQKQRDAGSTFGPYLPLIIEACGEAEFSYEYRHGVISHGAFTYALSKRLRKTGIINFQKLVDGTREELAVLGYQQTPQILGPTKIRNARVPWMR